MSILPTHAEVEPSINAEFKAAAQSRYAELRALGPIHRARILNGLPRWLVVGYELGRHALTHPALLKDNTPAGDTLDAYLTVRPGAGIGPNMLFTDPPGHTRLRKLVAAAFTRPRTEALGAPLARLETEIGLGTLLRRFPHIRPLLPTAELDRIAAGMMRGPLSLPVTVTEGRVPR